MAYQMAATAVTLNDIECYSQVASLFKRNRSNILQHSTRFQVTVYSRFICISRPSCFIFTTTI